LEEQRRFVIACVRDETFILLSRLGRSQKNSREVPKWIVLRYSVEVR
jgi:ribosomal protein L39E